MRRAGETASDRLERRGPAGGVRAVRRSLLGGLLAVSALAAISRDPLAQTYSADRILAGEVEQVWSIHTDDLDGDGDQDVISYTSHDRYPDFPGAVLWHENLDGLGTIGNPRVITTAVEGIGGVFTADLDGDLDADVLSASRNDGRLLWFENLDGRGSFGPPRVITEDSYPASTIRAADLDGDGDQDVLSYVFQAGIGHLLFWYENLDGHGAFGIRRIVSGQVLDPIDIEAADLDGDGDVDMLAASYLDGRIMWHENLDGQGNFGPERLISDVFDRPVDILVEDFDGDGDQDVAAGSFNTDRVTWFENADGLGSFTAHADVTATADGLRKIDAADLDGDGDVDLLSASMEDDKIAWYENLDGQGSFGAERILTTSFDGASSVFAADLDGDGDREVLAGAVWGHHITVHENLDGFGSFGAARELTAVALGARGVSAGDLDGDGDLDVISAAADGDRITWHENLDGHGAIVPRQIVTELADRVHDVAPADLDGDGDLDLVAAIRGDDTVVWYRNTDAQGSFGAAIPITTQGNGPWAVTSSDLDGDGDRDVLVAEEGSVPWATTRIAWYENTDGLGAFGPRRVITSQIEGGSAVVAADLDGDGDPDVLSASKRDDKIAWYENTDGLGTFGGQRVLTTSADVARSVHAADLDGDGDLDVLAASEGDDTVAWFENLDGLGGFGLERVITDAAGGASSVVAVDTDGDGDLDVAVAAAGEDSVLRFENLDGLGTFGPRRTVTSAAEGVCALVVADLDGNGRPDLLSASPDGDRLAWYGNGTWASVRFRNAVPNPASHTTQSLPILGITYVARIDVGSTGHSHAMLAGYGRRATLPLGAGQVLLVDPSTPEYLGLPSAPGPNAKIEVPIPVDVTLLGYEIYTQAAHFGGVTPFALSNALDLRIGYSDTDY